MAVLSDLLAPSVVTGIVSRIYAPGDILQRFFGMQIGGPNVDQVPGRAYSWDIFDNVRDAAYGRAPATGPANVAPNPVGRQTNTFPRSYEKVPVSYELLNNLRTIGKNAGQRDKMGAAYLENQARYVKTRANNFRELLLAALLTQGTISFQFAGDNWLPVFSLGANAGLTISWQVPSGNLLINGGFAAGLNMTGAGNIVTAAWSNASTDVIGQLVAISQAFQQLVGAPLARVMTDSTVWLYVLKNTGVQNLAGSANTGYAEYEYLGGQDRGPDGNKVSMFRARIKALPWLEWVICDAGLNVNGTFTRFWNGRYATFMIEHDPMWLKMQEGSEPVKENPIAPAVEQFGFHSWLREWDEPARIELHALQNVIPELRIPKALAIAAVA